MNIIFIRHAESEANVACIINDDPARPVPLTEHGRAQAQAAAEALRAMPFTHAYASEFLRAQQTAAILLRHHHCTPDIDARLNERHTGMDGLRVDMFNDLVRSDLLHTRPPGRIVRRAGGTVAQLHGRGCSASPAGNGAGSVMRIRYWRRWQWGAISRRWW